jgi:hypothetical protein
MVFLHLFACIVPQAVYEQLFDLIVERINVALDPSASTEAASKGSKFFSPCFRFSLFSRTFFILF